MGVRFLRFASLHMSNSSLRHSGMRRKAQTRNPSRRSYAGEMDSGFDASHRPGMTAVHCWRSSAFPRGKSPPGDLVVPPKTEGAGNAGCSAAPAASRANEKSTRASHHRFAETLRHSPRNGFNGFLRGLPGEPGFVASVACGDHHRLDTSVGVSGRHDFAVRIDAPRLRASPRPPHLPPNV